jgi:hypothetical protein
MPGFVQQCGKIGLLKQADQRAPVRELDFIDKATKIVGREMYCAGCKTAMQY